MDHTDEQYWERIAREHPYWGVLSEERFRGAEIDAPLKDEFLAQGVRDIDYAAAMIRRYTDGEFAPKAALDFGCGVGRLAQAMAARADQVTGVDVSAAMVARAQADAQARGIANVRFTTQLPDGHFDWINSFIVFQHIQPRKGIALLEQLMARLVVGGVISLHFTIFRDNRIWYRGVQESEFARYDGETFVNYSRTALHDMPIYEYDLSEIVCRIVTNGIPAIAMRHIDHQGLHGVWIVGRREWAPPA